KRIWNFLVTSAQKNKLAHAYLFCGPAEIGKRTLAQKFSRRLLCQKPKNKDGFPCGQCSSCQKAAKNQHPDLLWLQPRSEESRGAVKIFDIGIGEIKDLQHQLSLTPYSADYKIALVDGIERMTSQALNSFLKTLEEPPRRSLIFLIAADWRGLLPTIISRCQLIKFLPVPEKEIAAALKDETHSPAQLRQIVKLASGRPGRAIKLLTEEELANQYQQNAAVFQKIAKKDLIYRFELAKELASNTAVAQEFLGQWSLWLRDGLLAANGLSDLAVYQDSVAGRLPENAVKSIAAIEQAKRLLNNASFNAKLVLETLMIKI
ncbi:MAG: DNA polymerase III subunit delta', partial [Candidatus Portnoybacteria bacterium]|nr:DNA polymerase III subunit delta' [Candidatus Portnoybacteria bacterium]